MQIAICTRQDDPHSVLPALASSVHTLHRRAPETDVDFSDFHVVLVDTAIGLQEARALCSALARATAAPLLAVLDEGSLIAVDARWGVVDILLSTSSPAEIEFRLRTASARRRRTDRRTGRYVVGPLMLDHQHEKAWLYGRRLAVPGRTFALLEALASTPGRVRTRDDLLEQAWGTRWHDSSTVGIHIRRLRLALGDHATAVVTVRGAGYLLDPGQFAPESGSTGLV